MRFIIVFFDLIHKKLDDLYIIKFAAALTGGRILNLLISLLLLIIQSRFLGPEVIGFIGKFSIPLGYLWILTLGIPSALARELPYFMAREDKNIAIQYAQTAQSYSLFIGLLCSIGFIIPTIRAIVLGDYLVAMGWSFQIINAFFYMYNSYILTLFRTNDEFIHLAKSKSIASLTSLFVFPLVFINPYFGLFLKSTLSSIVSSLYLHKYRPLKIGVKFDSHIFFELLKFGFPIIVIGYIEANLWNSIQATIIMRYAGITMFGLYTFVLRIMEILFIIPDSFAEIFRPKLSSAFGNYNGDFQRTLSMIFKPLLFTLVFSIGATIISYLLLDDIVEWLFPKYSGSIPIIQSALPLLPIMSIRVIKYMFVVSKDLRNNLISTLPGFIVGLSLLYVLLNNDFGFSYLFLPYLMGQIINLVVTLIILKNKFALK